MKTLTAPITTQQGADASIWGEVYDVYLKSAISMPWGTTDTLRLTSLPGDYNFFTPKFDPEPSGTRGNAALYRHWPISRQVVKGDRKSANDKFVIAASNITGDWATMLSAVDWYDTPVVVRIVSPAIVSPTADDCATLFSGQVDSAQVTLEQIQIACSNGLALLNVTAPRENMHSNCRFGWADDQCTQLRWRTTNYKAGTVGNASTTTLVKSSNLTEDSGSNGSYGTDLINALADANFTASSEDAGYTNVACLASASDDTIIRNDLGAHNLQTGDQVTFNGTTAPGGITFGVTYYVEYRSASYFSVRATPTSPRVNITSSGSNVTFSTPSFKAKDVKSGSTTGFWKISSSSDWGTLQNGYYRIPDAQAGLANPELKPWMRIDFGSAQQPKLWRISSVANEGRLEELIRLIVFFSSADDTNWVHEGYFELPPRGGTLFDVLIPLASSARYWRLCIRSRWGVTFSNNMINKLYAYTGGRNYWASGRITFDSNTSTVALRNVSRKVLQSYSGEVVVEKLPVAPANGDTFHIERGCPRTFNGCSERRNWENFGGFTDLPLQTIIR